MSKTVLIIDDEEKLRTLLKRIIALEGFEVHTSESLAAAEKVLAKHAVNVVLCDVKLPDGNGVDFVSFIKTKYPDIEIILLTAYGNIPDGVQAMKNGAFDYIVKGDDNDKIIPLLNRAFEKNELQEKIKRLEQSISKQYSFDSIIGNAKPLLDAKQLAQKVSAADTTVLLLGETGTGKEVFAQAIHANSPRKSNSFVALNCSAFSKELLESELFGHKAGAFTGAMKDKKGLIEEANNGTLFLDEMGEMPLDLQAKLLRVLENNEFIKVGDTKLSKTNVRFIAATNRNLQEDVHAGKFREDLFYRLNVFTITLPSLRERPNDIPELAQYFIDFFSRKTNKTITKMSADFIHQLTRHSWKGNIRELKNIIERAIILADGEELTTYNLPAELQMKGQSFANNSFTTLADLEKYHIQKILQQTNGNKTETARLLDIGLTTLYRKIEEYGLR